MKKTGQLLKDKREASKLSISEVALATKINPKILNAIENGEESILPAKTFLKGFLKSYALFLKMDPEDVLRSYQEETGGPPPQVVHEIHQPKPVVETPAAAPSLHASAQQSRPERRKGDRRRMADENSSGMRTAAVIVIVLLIGVIIGVRELIEKYQREKQVESTQVKVTPLEQPPVAAGTEAKPAETASATPTTPAPAQNPAPAPAPAAEPAPAPKPAQNEIMHSPAPAPAPAPTLPPPPAPVAVAPPPPAPAPLPTPPPKPAEVKAADTKPAPPPPPAPAVEKAEEKTVNADPAKKAKVEIILEALDKVDVKFQIKGETKRLSLGPTQVHTIHADQPVTLDLSDGGAVNIILNGRERGVPGDLGKPKTIKIP